MRTEVKFSELLGKTLISIYSEDDKLTFNCDTGETYEMYHDQDCCESVIIESIEGYLSDLMGTPILQADEETNCDITEGTNPYADSFTWTFYRLATIKGFVTIRWLGESNGYYSESVSLYKNN